MSRVVAAAAISAALAVGAAAFGAHIARGDAVGWLRTGGEYQLIHAVAALVLADRARGVAITLLAGSGIFALSLYLMAVGGPRWLGAITPSGGVLMIAGWSWLAYLAWRQRSEQ